MITITEKKGEICWREMILGIPWNRFVRPREEAKTRVKRFGQTQRQNQDMFMPIAGVVWFTGCVFKGE
jgi:hypothetical protein